MHAAGQLSSFATVMSATFHSLQPRPEDIRPVCWVLPGSMSRNEKRPGSRQESAPSTRDFEKACKAFSTDVAQVLASVQQRVVFHKESIVCRVPAALELRERSSQVRVDKDSLMMSGELTCLLR